MLNVSEEALEHHRFTGLNNTDLGAMIDEAGKLVRELTGTTL